MALTVDALPCSAASYQSRLSALVSLSNTFVVFLCFLPLRVIHQSLFQITFSLLLKLFCSVANVSDGLDGLKYLYKTMINNTSLASSCLLSF